MNISKVQWIPVAWGAVAWAAAIAMVWLRFRRATTAEREEDFALWKAAHGEPHATFGQFLGSEQTPRTYLGRASLCAVMSALAFLALMEALRHWGVFI
jgi:hypothetical protein